VEVAQTQWCDPGQIEADILAQAGDEVLHCLDLPMSFDENVTLPGRHL